MFKANFIYLAFLLKLYFPYWIGLLSSLKQPLTEVQLDH